MNDFILMAVDEHGATSTHEFQVHVFNDPSTQQILNTGWPLMLTFVGVVFAWGCHRFRFTFYKFKKLCIIF